MKVFISWSGEKSKRIAEVFRGWLPSVIQAIKPYCSSEDIAKGSHWAIELLKELEETIVGLIILTPENLEEPWIMFEAGALSKKVTQSRVCPVLFDVKKVDVKGPLSQFQLTDFTKDDIEKVLKTINQSLDKEKLDDTTFKTVYEKWWTDLGNPIKTILRDHSKMIKTERDQKDILEEVLNLTRSISQNTEDMKNKSIFYLPSPYSKFAPHPSFFIMDSSNISAMVGPPISGSSFTVVEPLVAEPSDKASQSEQAPTQPLDKKKT